MTLAAKNRGDYMCGSRGQWQYRASPPGLYAQHRTELEETP